MFVHEAGPVRDEGLIRDRPSTERLDEGGGQGPAETRLSNPGYSYVSEERFTRGLRPPPLQRVHVGYGEQWGQSREFLFM